MRSRVDARLSRKSVINFMILISFILCVLSVSKSLFSSPLPFYAAQQAIQTQLTHLNITRLTDFNTARTNHLLILDAGVRARNRDAALSTHINVSKLAFRLRAQYLVV